MCLYVEDESKTESRSQMEQRQKQKWGKYKNGAKHEQITTADHRQRITLLVLNLLCTLAATMIWNQVEMTSKVAWES